MTKYDLQNLVVECLQDYFAASAPTIKENTTMKKSELKALVTEVVKQCVKEAGPQYKVRGKKSQLEQPGLRNKAREMQCDPEINEVAPPGGEDVVKALKKKSNVDNPWAVAWSMKKKGQIEGESPVDGLEDSPEEHAYDEAEEVELLKQLGQIVLRLLQMHRGKDITGNETDDEVPLKDVPEKDEIEPEPEEDEESELQESNYRVQHRSGKTVKDYPGNPDPAGKRDPEVPEP